MSLILDFLFPRPDLKILDSLPTNPVKYLPNSKLEGVVSVFKYDGPLKMIISDLKFEFVSSLADQLTSTVTARLYQDFPNIVKYWQDNHFIIVPIPLHRRRQNWRGFNQSQLISQRLSILLNLPIIPDIISRKTYTNPQAKIKDKSQRKANIDSSFILLNGNYSKIILVDDVCTTGSTLESAASVFSDDANIWGLTIAG